MQALVVDDAAAVRELLVEHMSQLGFQVEQAANGAEALARLQTMSDVAVVLLDWTMPEMDGLETLRRLRTDARWTDLPVVMITSDSELPFVETAFEAGASEYLIQPFDGQAVLEKLLLLGVDPEARRAA